MKDGALAMEAKCMASIILHTMEKLRMISARNYMTVTRQCAVFMPKQQVNSLWNKLKECAMTNSTSDRKSSVLFWLSITWQEISLASQQLEAELVKNKSCTTGAFPM